MSLTTSTIVGRIAFPDNAPLAGGVIEFELSSFDTQGANLVPGLSDARFTLDADGSIPAGAQLWSNTSGPRGTRYTVSVRSPDYACPYHAFTLGEIVVSNAPPYDLGALLMRGAAGCVIKLSGGEVTTFLRGGVVYTQIMFRQSGTLNASAPVSGAKWALVGGGGSGGARASGSTPSGGGGASSPVLSSSPAVLPAGVHSITIGAGGAATPLGGVAGSDSSVSGPLPLTSKGGGGGGTASSAALAPGGNGGNGGGGAGGTSSNWPGGSGIPGHPGGRGKSGAAQDDRGGGGGGGAAGPGQDGASGVGGIGGGGVMLSFTEPPLVVSRGGDGSDFSAPKPSPSEINGNGSNGIYGLSSGSGGDGLFVLVFPTANAIVVTA